MNTSCGKMSGGKVGQSLVDQRPVFCNGHKPRPTVMSRKGGVYRPTKRVKHTKFI